MMSDENTTHSKDKTPLYTHYFQKLNTPRAVVSIVHGLGEHAVRYEPLAEFLATHNIACIGIDLRGHGKSSGKRGVANDLDLLFDDVDALLDETTKTYTDIPHFLFGHSLGGWLVLHHGLIRGTSGLAGVISQAPGLKAMAAPNAVMTGALKMLRTIAPRLTAGNQLKAKDLSTVLSEVHKYQNDPLVHDQVSAGLVLNMVAGGAYCIEHAKDWKTPLLLMHGQKDNITDATASEKFAQSAPHTEFHMLEEGLHEIHNDTTRSKVYDLIAGFIEKQIGSTNNTGEI